MTPPAKKPKAAPKADPVELDETLPAADEDTASAAPSGLHDLAIAACLGAQSRSAGARIIAAMALSADGDVRMIDNAITLQEAMNRADELVQLSDGTIAAVGMLGGDGAARAVIDGEQYDFPTWPPPEDAVDDDV